MCESITPTAYRHYWEVGDKDYLIKGSTCVCGAVSLDRYIKMAPSSALFFALDSTSKVKGDR